MGNCTCFYREEWTEAIQAVADRLQRQEEERMNCSPTSQIDNIGEEEMDASTTHHKRKVENSNLSPTEHSLCYGRNMLKIAICKKYWPMILRYTNI